MAFYTGTFSTFSSLKDSVQTALLSHGWTLDANGVLVKGALYFRFTATTSQLLLEAGTGSGATTLAGAAPNGVKIMDFTGSPMSLPASYDLHVNESPDEVYLVVVYNSDKVQQLSFGASNVPQIGGTGAWFSGSFPASASASQNHLIYGNNTQSSAGWGWQGMGCGLFFEAYNVSLSCSFIHTGLDTVEWRRVYTGDGPLVGSGDVVAGLLQALPSQFNQNTVLLPLLVVQRRLSRGQTVVADMVNARLCRNDNHMLGEVVSYGAESWKIYPFHRKNTEARNAVPWPTGSSHTGTFAFALRYTGP